MSEKYYPPTYQKQDFHCPHCHVHAKQLWYRLYYGSSGFEDVSSHLLCICSYCNRNSIWNTETERMVDPVISTHIPPHDDMPESIKRLYLEALSVYDLSPKASSALLRLALQELMPLIGATTGKLDKDIAKLVSEGLDAKIQKALDYCRVIGNNAVHPNEINLDDTPEMAYMMFEMLNFIIEEKIAKPKRIDELFSSLPKGALEAIEKRDKK